MARQRIKRDDIVIGKPIRFSIYDGEGKLLLTEGSVIRSVFQLNTLVERGIYAMEGSIIKKEDADEPIVAKFYPFQIIDEVYSDLKDILGRGTIDQRLPSRIIKLCSRLQQASEVDHDACLGMICFDQSYQYPVIHSIHTALVCKTVLKQLGWEPERRLVPMAAAMTMNISMIELQDKLHTQNGPLTREQRAEVLSHPEKSVEILKKCGVNDQVWLNTILQHHELLDGSGYPYAQKEKNIAQSSRIVTLGDIYGAKITGRSYRKPILATAALRELFLGKRQCTDVSISKLLIKNLGLFPPGSFVELNNGEIAVVTRVGKDARYPVVSSVVKTDGRVYARPVERDSSMEEFGIKKILPKNEARVEVNRYQLWGYI